MRPPNRHAHALPIVQPPKDSTPVSVRRSMPKQRFTELVLLAPRDIPPDTFEAKLPKYAAVGTIPLFSA